MTESPLAAAQRLFAQAVDALRGVAEAGAADERVSVLRLCEGMARQLDQVTVATVAGLDREGVFAERGYKSRDAGVERSARLGARRGPPPGERRRAGRPADRAGRLGVAGSAARDRCGVRAGPDEPAAHRGHHPAAGSQPAGRLSPQQWADAEAQLAGGPADYTPTELHNWGKALVELLDQDGEEPDDRPPAQINELSCPGSGRRREAQGPVRRRRDVRRDRRGDRRPRQAVDRATTTAAPGERQAEALADVCGYVLDHGDVPSAAGTART